ncbi:MAG: PrsW family intramembrane metalloprotease, partial [Anaerolineae bacterium]|nr:PrsW family intramembrane metalloprotease [Anaerolineae bacterium]
PNHPITESPNHPIVTGVWFLVLSALLLVCGLCAGTFYLVAPFFAPTRQEAVQTNVVVGAVAAIGIVFGALFAWQALAAMRHHTPAITTRLFPSPILLFLAFLLALVLGSSVLALEPIAAFVFPTFHFLASALLPFSLLAYAARQLNVTSSLRALVASLGWGALGSTFLALSLEAIIGVIILVGISVAIVLTPDGTLLLERLSTELRTLRAFDERAALRFLLANPGIIALGLIYFAGIVPLIEEAVKTLGLALMNPMHTRARDAVLWGVAAGAGFAFVENALNTGMMLELWAVAMLARVGATIMHTATGITMARGWYAARVERRWDKLLIAYAASVFVHAIWNVFAAGQALGIVGLMSEGRALRVESLWLWLNVAMLTGLTILTFGGISWIVYAVRTAREPTAS